MAAHVAETANWNGHQFTPTWLPSFTCSAGDIVTQASGICFTPEGKMLLVEDESTGEKMLPGGHPEGNETPLEALVREVWEEACAVVESAVYLGAQSVADERGRVYYQTRFWAKVRLEPFEPRFETSRRLLVEPADFVDTLNWSTPRLARAVLGAALSAEHGFATSSFATSG